MRVGIDYRGAQCSGSESRGIGRYTNDLIKGLIEFAPEIELTLFHRSGIAVPSEVGQSCQLVSVDAFSWTDPITELWGRIPKVRSLASLHQKRFDRALFEQKVAMETALATNPVDVLHIPSALDIGSYPIYNYPCPTVMTFLDAIVLKLHENSFDRFRTFEQRYYMRQVENLKTADRIVSISHASALDAVDFFEVEASKVDVVYPVVSKEFGVRRSAPHRTHGKPYFLFCSVPDSHKNPGVVLAAFRSMSQEYRMVMIAPNTSASMQRINELAIANDVQERVDVTGFVSEDELIALFQHATALVSPSQMEGFGLPVAQAMRAGTPIVTSKFSAQGEIAEGVGYLIDSHSIDEVANAMNQVIADKRDEVRIKRGLERASLFDAEKVTSELVESYRKAL